MENKKDRINFNETDPKSIFRLPEDYFGKFPLRLSDRIETTKKPSGLGRLFHLPQLRFAAAAVLIVLLFVTVIDRELIFSDPSDKYIEELIENYSYDIDENFIVSYIEEETDIYNNEEEISDEMIEYLLDEGIDLESILDALE